MAETSGIEKFLRRTLSLQEIKDLSARAHAAILNGEDLVAITSSSFEGGSAGGQLTASALHVGKICEDIIEDLEGTVTYSRKLFVRADFATNTEQNYSTPATE